MNIKQTFFFLTVAYLVSACSSLQPVWDEPIKGESIDDISTEDSAIDGTAVTVAGGWLPEIPMPDNYDWIKLNSGEWLKGRLIAMYSNEVEFDSEKLDSQMFDWEDVVEVRTHRAKSLLLADGSIVEGTLYMQGDNVSVIGAGPLMFKRSSLLSIASSRHDGAKNLWGGKATLGANTRKGNTSQDDAAVNINVYRRTAINRLQLKYVGNYSRADSSVTENNHRFETVYDVSYSKEIFLRPLSVDLLKDKFQNVAYRATYSAGAGYFYIDTPKTSWNFNGGVGYQYTKFDEVPVNESNTASTPVLELGTDFSAELTSTIDFMFLYGVQLVSDEAGEGIHHAETGVSIDLVNDFELDLSIVWDRINKPTADAEGVAPGKDNSRLVIGIGYEF